MAKVGIRELKQNASAVVATARQGETVTVTERGRPVAVLSAIADTRLAQLIAGGEARPATRAAADLPAPEPGPVLSDDLYASREAERY